MEQHPFVRFISLVNFDQKLQSLENEKITVEDQIAVLKKQENEAVLALEDARNRIFQLKKNVDEQELEMKVLDQKEKDKKKHLENLADYKDYHAIKLEVDHIQRLQVEQEKNVLAAWNQLENAQNNLEKKQGEHQSQVNDMHQSIKQLGEKSENLGNECAAMITQRVSIEEGVPSEWLEKYTLMRARVADPVVAIYHKSCGACSYLITMQDMARAQHGALVQCQKCYRLLYVPEIMEKHTDIKR